SRTFKMEAVTVPVLVLELEFEPEFEFEEPVVCFVVINCDDTQPICPLNEIFDQFSFASIKSASVPLFNEPITWKLVPGPLRNLGPSTVDTILDEDMLGV